MLIYETSEQNLTFLCEIIMIVLLHELIYSIIHKFMIPSVEGLKKSFENNILGKKIHLMGQYLIFFLICFFYFQGECIIYVYNFRLNNKRIFDIKPSAAIGFVFENALLFHALCFNATASKIPIVKSKSCQ